MTHRSVLGSLTFAAFAVALLAACDSTTTSVGGISGGGGSGAGSTSSSTGGGGSTSDPLYVDKVDILIAVDNSRSMADKQGFLAYAMADLLQNLVNPTCIDPGGQPATIQPGSGIDPCPEGTTREFSAMNDIHIGVISSSLGGHGSDACAVGADPTTSTNNDMAHLLSRVAPGDPTSVPTYLNGGFLAWDPLGQKSPPGENDWTTLATNLQDIVLGVGQVGCGFESQLEATYRFLADPAPYETISVDAQSVIQVSGVDNVLLEQRSQFLRPDSLVLVIMLTDENDCSTNESGQFYLANQLQSGGGSPFHLPKARAICQTDPNSACCRSCGQPAGVDENGNACAEDPTCGILDDLGDAVNMRCFDQKRRFGIDFMYPMDRYSTALTQASIADRNGQIVPNPLFSDLDPSDGVSPPRDPRLVVFAGIVGVPYQDVARDPQDLGQGFKSPDELAADLGGFSTWDAILGQPINFVYPQDPYMVESIGPRSGQNPITGDGIAPPGSLTSPINGSEYSVPGQDDLQYACTFSLPVPRDCSPSSAEPACDCSDPTNDNPLCEANPADGGSRTLQVRAKSYPGIRQLSVLKDVGDNGVVTSICPSQIDDPSAASFGYRPVAASILERIKVNLQP